MKRTMVVMVALIVLGQAAPAGAQVLRPKGPFEKVARLEAQPVPVCTKMEHHLRLCGNRP